MYNRHITEYSLTDEEWKDFDNIRVVCRFRPPNRKELQFTKKTNTPDRPPQFASEQTIHLARHVNPNQSNQLSKSKPFKCTLDTILSEKTTQKQVFYLVGQPMILSCLEDLIQLYLHMDNLDLVKLTQFCLYIKYICDYLVVNTQNMYEEHHHQITLT